MNSDSSIGNTTGHLEPEGAKLKTMWGVGKRCFRVNEGMKIILNCVQGHFLTYNSKTHLHVVSYPLPTNPVRVLLPDFRGSPLQSPSVFSPRIFYTAPSLFLVVDSDR